MLDKIDLSQRLEQKEFKMLIKPLEEKLNELQQKIKDIGIPVIILFEGWSASGKGTIISRLRNPLDPRYYNVYPMNRITEDSYMRPYIWSYFTKTPEKGRITILDKSWHRGLFPDSLSKWKLNKEERGSYYEDINTFEEQLTNDRNVIIKFFLHISKSEQKTRFKSLEANPNTKWRVDEKDWEQNKKYDKFTERFENMILKTNTGESPWNIIEANDSLFATVKVYEVLIKILEEKIFEFSTPCEQFREHELTPNQTSILSSVDAAKDISDEEYKIKLAKYQRKVSELCFELYAKRRSVVVAYEGWDAAGKGGNIKRLTQPMDPRAYEVIPIAAPTKEDLSHHYLWRFWHKYPKDGHIAIFDRSWYGRVLVERVEGFCSANEWRRAFKEIKDMERQFVHHGTIVFKFWLQIDKDEQLRRFTARQEDPLKQYKITEEDWRNREKWDLYEQAVNEMLLQTDTDYAPWTIIESNSKKHARIKVLEKFVETLEKNL
ncbi:polyphosphate:AMP phosphotransferase [Clostridia bacterium]|nr:polyphosphate:AMP phosphotransferase [Clostridia bacterium]